MPIHELVASIQSIFPPSGQIPQPTPDQIEDRDVQGLPPELSPIPRDPVPDWIKPGEGTSFPVDAILLIEGDIPITQPAQLGPVDALAYYLPFHFYANGWGIYLRASGVLSVASMLASASGRALSGDPLSLATEILLQHERFHFFSEIACSRAEIISGYKLYYDYFQDHAATAVEEALCNAHSFRKALRRQPAAIREQVKQWMQTQGPGYQDFQRCCTPSAFTRWRRVAILRMLRPMAGNVVLVRTGKLTPLWSPGCVIWSENENLENFSRDMGVIPQYPEATPTEFLFTGLARSTAPTYLVHDAAGVGVLKPFPKYDGMRIQVYSRDHPPPHIHVEIPPGRDFTRLEWSTLQPLSGDHALSRRQRKSLDNYLSKFGNEIDERIQRFYHSAAQPRRSTGCCKTRRAR